MSAPIRTMAAPAAALAFVLAACGSGTPSAVPETGTPSQAASQAPTQAASPTTAATPTEAPTAAPTEAPATPTADPLAFVAPYEGTYSGTWLNETFGSTGPVSVTVELDRAAGAIVLELELGGNVFGNPAPKPETLTATIAPGAGLTFDSKTFGETTLSVDLAAGAPVVTMSSPDVPSDRIKTFTATTTITDPETLEFEYEVTFRDGIPPATGTATLTR
ncbi:MAG: hypothetical protein FIA92_15280 [Chloroflexi bacterium]|nr:hypothetical protein [Chloroflexota bacterium]